MFWSVFLCTHATAHITLHQPIGPGHAQTLMKWCVFTIKQRFDYRARCAAFERHLCLVCIAVDVQEGFFWCRLKRSVAAGLTWFSDFTCVCWTHMFCLWGNLFCRVFFFFLHSWPNSLHLSTYPFWILIASWGWVPLNQCLQWFVWHWDFFLSLAHYLCAAIQQNGSHVCSYVLSLWEEYFIPQACNLFYPSCCYISPQWCQAGLLSAITLKNNRIKGQPEPFSRRDRAMSLSRWAPLSLHPCLLAEISARCATFDM